MASKEQVESLAEYLNCPFCNEFFDQLVILDCDHNFCQACIQLHWEGDESNPCPQCGFAVIESGLRANRALGHLVDTTRNLILPRARKEHSPGPLLFGRPRKAEPKLYSKEHHEQLKLFCETNRELICAMCLDGRTGGNHRQHDFMRQEAVEKYKDKLKSTLDLLRQKMTVLETKLKRKERFTEIRGEATSLRCIISPEFAKMHQFLHRKEKGLIRELKKHEENTSETMEKNSDKFQETLESARQKLTRLHSKVNQREIVNFLEEEAS
ncbi:E3 ubiquitin-protein ligase TRIM69-like [Mobula hypostoma]|uniref:E3 ubiquitin-protein ligase TRIM69-like n=1 Tax=Mobula hypostoma TaxID=723540 RepID=UPI002FC37E82